VRGSELGWPAAGLLGAGADGPVAEVRGLGFGVVVEFEAGFGVVPVVAAWVRAGVQELPVWAGRTSLGGLRTSGRRLRLRAGSGLLLECSGGRSVRLLGRWG